ncbi:UNVERIFIED_CONTAM: hypothetical protein FKN15_027631 [Acipenser sinensis]
MPVALRIPIDPKLFQCLRYTDRQRLLQAARKSTQVIVQGQKLYFYMDYSAVIAVKRRAFGESMKEEAHGSRVCLMCSAPGPGFISHKWCVHRASKRRSVERRGACTEHRSAEASSVEVRAPSIEAPKRRASRCVHRASKRRSVERRGACTERREACTEHRCAERRSVERRGVCFERRGACVRRASRCMRRASKRRGACTECRGVKRRGACTERRGACTDEHQIPSAEALSTKRRSAAQSAEALHQAQKR